MVIKEYVCMAHGAFEGTEPACPHGCTGNMVTREFRTPFSYPQKAGGIDRTLNNLANDFGLTNMSNDHGQSAVKVADDSFAPRWGDPAQTIKTYGAGGNVVSGMAGKLKPVESQIPANIRAASARDLK